MQLSKAFNPRRIARTLITVFVLSLIPTVVPPVVSPIISAPKAEAVDVPYANATGGTDVVVPAGVFSITLTARGAAGGTGGNDGAPYPGTSSTNVGYAAGTFAVTPGDRITIYPGGAGGNGTNGASNSGGGTAGTASIPTNSNTKTPSAKINGVFTDQLIVNGGAGGPAGAGGSSGGGAGGGAASLILINDDVALIAAGGGGGGGGSGGVAQNTTTFTANTSAIGANGTNGGTCGNTDGGGTGGGGGGWYGGAAGALDRPGGTGECRAFSGSRGTNFVSNSASSATNSYISPNGAGFISYVFNFSATTTCATTSQTVDIYTVVKVTTTANCTWTVPSTVSTVDLFLVGGGGGGAGDGGPGGNGGFATSRTAVPVTPNSTMTLKVGYGGAESNWGLTSNAYYGDSTTVVTSTGAVFYALGGATNDNGPSFAARAVQTAQNGSFAGGKGGDGAGCFNVGTAGKRGISNYFYGTLNTYGGGGGAGSCPNGAATTPAAGADGGGAGGYASSSTVNQPGTNGTDGTGGGGGGGTATGTGLKLPGGKGGSGVILIRYATDSLNAFPSTLSSSLHSRWVPGDLQVLDSAREAMIDSAGKSAAGVVSGNPYIFNRGTMDLTNQTQSSKTLMAMKGGTSDSINLASLPSDNYTMFHVARYVTNGSTGRLFSANSGNWISGFYSGMNGCAHHNSWLTGSGCDSDSLYGWELSMDQLYYYRHNGEDVSMSRDSIATQSRSDTFGINNYWNGQKADWEVADVIVFDRKLAAGEIRQMEAYLARIYGLTLSQASGSHESDTAYTWNSQYYYGQYDTGFYINDTFTVEGWVKPGAECTSSYCSWFSLQVALVTKIDGGTFQYALGGTASGSGYVWTNTGVKIPTGEWHHIALVKKLIGNQANAMEFYLDGQLAFVDSGSPYNNNAASGSTTDVVTAYDSWYYLGVRANESANFRGSMDEFKFWKVARTGTQIADDMHSNDASDPGLQLYYDFNFNSLSNSLDLRNLAMSGPSRTDMVASGTHKYEDVKLVSTSTPYTTIKFPRTYITQSGGWKVPESVTMASTIVVGGGGGGGYGNTNNRPAGAGGGGGVTASLTQSYIPGSTVQVKVGQGGLGGYALDDPSVRNGQSSIVGVGSTLTALGGGGGGNVSETRVAGGSSIATGGGSGESTYMCSGTPPNAGPSGGTFVNGGTVTSGYNGAGGVWGWGGSGGGARGAATNGDCNSNQAGVPGPGYVDPVTSIEYGRGGNAAGYSVTSLITGYTTQNNGWGGIISYNGGASGLGYRGSSGTVVIRYITAAKPSFTKPTNAYLNVGMTETFTTNVAQDSATVGLTRTFRWESTTAGAGGTFSPIKVGTGAANAAFSWIPSDTSTSGSQYLYRVVVTDSDTIGLYVQDTSPAVFAVINPALQFTSTSTSIKKTLNLAQSETITISQGTPGYRYSLSPVLPGVTIDTSTAGVAVLKIAETATVGTYIETLTVTDSVSATLAIPITLNISTPPSLTAIGEVVKNYQVLNLDASNRWSVQGVDGVATNGLVWKDQSGNKRDAQTNNASAINGTSCKAPVFTTDNGGAFNFNGTDTCYYTPYLGSQFTNAYTVEAWIRPSSNSIPNGYQILSQMYNTVGEQISLVMGDLDQNTGKIYVGFYSGNGWRFANFPITPVANTWMHIAGTYDGTTLKTFLNGVLLGSTTYSSFGTLNSKGYFIGKRWDSTYFYTGSIAEVRAYSVPLTDTQVAQNFSATKYRFDPTNINILKPSQKYGTITLESFTVTSGGETETVSFAVGNRAGISWDTASTPGQVKLTVQETLTPGTYHDTITVTDNFAQSTTLPIKFTVTKAETLTIYVETPTALNYTGSRALFAPSVKGIGAVGLESGTALSPSLRFKPAGTSCATGGYCRVGDIGPGGGIVFIDTSTTSSDGRIYEVAPQNWSGSDDLSTVNTYCSNPNLNLGTQIGIGWGETNTNLAKTNCLGGAVGRVNSFNLSNNSGYSDWFIPSKNEAVELAKIPVTAGLLNIGNNWSTGNWGYWSSSEDGSSVMWSIGHTGPVFSGNSRVLKSEASKNMVRPVRAFKSCWAIDTCTALLTTDTPTAAGIYVISPTSGASAATLAERYSAIRYLDSRLIINRIAQRAQVIPFINANFPDTFTVNVTEGNGNGAVTYSATNGTATGCGFDYKKLYAATQGTCTITVVKAGDRNYLPDTATAGMYLLSFVNNQTSPAVGSGATIALKGETAIVRDPNVAPTITSLSTYTGTAGVTQIIIYGAGFDSSNLAGITVKFWRNVIASGFTVNVGNDQITVTIPAGATTGRVSVTTPNGIAVSELPLTVTP